MREGSERERNTLVRDGLAWNVTIEEPATPFQDWGIYYRVSIRKSSRFAAGRLESGPAVATEKSLHEQ